MGRRRKFLLGTLTVVITVALCLLVAEVVLRFLPVSSGMRTVAVTAQNPVFHFTPIAILCSCAIGDMALANHGHVNNAGFVTDQDYRKDDERPLLAVIGDSMIEAGMITMRRTRGPNRCGRSWPNSRACRPMPSPPNSTSAGPCAMICRVPSSVIAST